MKDELLHFQKGGVSFVFLEQSLHRTPQKMPSAVQEEINKAANGDDDYIVLGIRPIRQPLVIPRAHDCISLFLGSTKRYQEEHEKEPGTYYLTKGWIEEGKSPIGIFQEYCQRYDKETAEWVIREELKNYTRIVLVDMGAEAEALREHAKENARFLHLRYEEIRGSLVFFEKMLQGCWDKDFIILKPGEEVTQELFLDL